MKFALSKEITCMEHGATIPTDTDVIEIAFVRYYLCVFSQISNASNSDKIR